MSSRSLYRFLIKKCGFKEVSINNCKHNCMYVSWEMDWRGCAKNDIFVLKTGSCYEGFTYACGELVVNALGNHDMKTILISTDPKDKEAAHIIKKGLFKDMLLKPNNYYELLRRVTNHSNRKALEALD